MEAILYGDGDRVVSGVEAAEEDLHADDVVGGDGEEPASGAAECRVGAVDGGAECGGGEAGTFGGSGGAGGGHDEGAAGRGVSNEVSVQALGLGGVRGEGEEWRGGAVEAVSQYRVD